MSQELDADELIDALLDLENEISSIAHEKNSERSKSDLLHQEAGVSRARLLVQEMRDGS